MGLNNLCINYIQSVLRLPEVDDASSRPFNSRHTEPEVAVVLENTTLSQRLAPRESSVEDDTLLVANSDSFQLRALNVIIKRGSLVGVCGSVGSGNIIFNWNR